MEANEPSMSSGSFSEEIENNSDEREKSNNDYENDNLEDPEEKQNDMIEAINVAREMAAEQDIVVYQNESSNNVSDKEKTDTIIENMARPQKPLYKENMGKSLVEKATIHLLDTYAYINEKYLDDTANKGSLGSKNPITTDSEGYFIPHIGDMLTLRYEITGILGKGSYSYVLRCWDNETNKPVAVKVFRKRKEITEAGIREFEILRVVSGVKRKTKSLKLSNNESNENNSKDEEQEHYDTVMSPYTPELYDGFIWNGHYCIVMELLGKSILDVYEAEHGMKLQTIKKVLQPLLELLVVFKSPGVGIVHCDLKPENILLTKGETQPIKLADFSSSCYVGGRGLEYAQTRPYRAPEIAFREPSYGCEVDMFSLGTILAELVLGSPLFKTTSKEDHALELIRTLGIPTKTMMLNARMNIFNKDAVEKISDDFQYNKNEHGYIETADIIEHIKDINYDLIGEKYKERLQNRGTRAYESEMMFLISSREGNKGVLTDYQRKQAYNFINLVLNMTLMNPVQRISPLTALSHPFMTE